MKILFLILLLIPSTSWATTWYIRSDGGTDTQCDGTHDAAYSSGSAQPCAYSHNYYLTGWYYDGSGATHGTMHMSGGDSVIFSKSGDSFKQGYDAAWTGCNAGSFPYECYPVAWPSGSAGATTKIYGFGGNTGATTINTYLWGTHSIGQVLYIGGSGSGTAKSYLDIYNLDISDHIECEKGGTAPPVTCNLTDDFSQDGIGGKGNDNITLHYLNIHGLARYGIQAPGASNWTYDHIIVNNNGYGGLSFDDGTGSGVAVTGAMNMNNSFVTFSGCGETYPGLATINCWGQDDNHGGYGDGIAFAAGTIGTWTISYSVISHNTQDGFDGKHGIHTGDSLTSYRNLFEGNGGQQIKMESNLTSNHDFIDGNCWYFSGKSYTFSGFTNADMCRALGNTFELGIAANEVHTLYNDTIIGNGDTAFLVDTDAGNDTCNSSTKLHLRNSIVYSGTDWHDDTTYFGSGGNKSTDIFYNGGTDGNGSGTCGGTSTVWDEDYNIFFGNKSGSGNGSIVGTHSSYADPVFSTDPSISHGSYTQNDNFYSLLSIQTSSPAKVTGVAGLTYANGSNDFWSNARGNPPSKGALEVASCSGSSNNCIINADCCGGTCTNFACGAGGGGGGGGSVSGMMWFGTFKGVFR